MRSPYREAEARAGSCEGCGDEVEADVPRCATCTSLERLRSSVMGAQADWLRRTAWWAAFLCLAGCGGASVETAGPYHGDVRFTEAERSAITRGDIFLAERLGVQPFGVVWDLQPGEVCARSVARGSSTGDFGHHSEGRVELDAARAGGNMEELATLAAHELGHARGVEGHHYDGSGVMCGSDREGTSCDYVLRWTSSDEFLFFPR